MTAGPRPAPEPLLEEARSRLVANRPLEAGALLDPLIERDPANAEAWYLRGTAKLEANSPEQALPDLLRAVALDASDPRRHFNLAVAHWRLNDVPRSVAALKTAIAADPGFAQAREFLAQMGLDGEHYHLLLERIHRHLTPRTYLEIGVDRGVSFSHVDPATIALGVDPDPHIEIALAPNQRVFAETSDDFFARRDVSAEFGGRALDLAFIDGMHWFEFALRDFINVERLCSRASTVLVHDVFPMSRDTAERERKGAFWTGDVWRLIVLLKKYRPDLSVHTVAAPPSGLAVIRNLDPGSRVITDALDVVVAEFMALDYSAIEDCRAEMLNLYANDWNAIRALLERDPRVA